MAIALFMAAIMLCSTVTNAQAAGFKKSFKKTVTIKGGKACQITLETKRATSVTVNVSLTKGKNTFVVINLNEQQSEMFQVPNGQLTVELEKGKYQLLVSNQAQKKVKAKVSVSADKAVLKYKSQKTTNALDSLG